MGDIPGANLRIGTDPLGATDIIVVIVVLFVVIGLPFFLVIVIVLVANVARC